MSDDGVHDTVPMDLPPNDPLGPVRWGVDQVVLAFGNGELTEAQRATLKALLPDADGPGARLLDDPTMFRGDEIPQVRESILDTVGADPTPALRLSLGRLLAERGELEAAQMTFEDVLADEPGHMSARRSLATVRWRRHDLDGGVRLLTESFGAAPQRDASLEALSDLIAEAGQIFGAVVLAKRLRATTSDRSDRALALDLVLLELIPRLDGTFEGWPFADGLDDVAEAVTLSTRTRSASTQLRVARSLSECGQDNHAWEVLDRLDRDALTATETGTWQYLRGLLCEREGHYEDAVAAYRSAVKSDPTQRDACFRALNLLLEDDSEDALTWIEELISQVDSEDVDLARLVTFGRVKRFAP